MNALALALALLAVAPGADPLPGDTGPVDSLVYTFGRNGGAGTAPAAFGGGSLRIAKDGKVSYHYSSDPFTGSGGRVVQQEWTLTKDELKELFAKMVADGLLEGTDSRSSLGGVQVTSGRWRTGIAADTVPTKALQHLRPLLTRADPRLWPEVAPAPRAAQPKAGTLTQFNYHFATKADGDFVLMYVGRDGEVSYQRYDHPTPNNTKTRVQTRWTIPAADAAAILDALAAGGVLTAEDVGPGKFPVHRVEAQVGRWFALFYLPERPEVVTKHLLPLMRKADPEFWK